MPSTNEQFFNCLCRTCMHELVEDSKFEGEHTEKQWHSIFATIEGFDSMRIAELVTSTIPQIEVQLSDHFPKKICSGCLQQLIGAKRFQQMCIESDQQMRVLIAERSTESNTTKEASVQKELKANKSLKQEFVLEPTTNRVEFGPNLLAEFPKTSATDPLHNGSDDISIYVKNEPCAEAYENDKYCYDEALPQTVFARNTVLIVEIENEQKKFANVCDICGKAFCTPYSLRAHTVKYHTSEKPNKSVKTLLLCELCDETCTTRSKLAKHKKLQHSVEKPQDTLNPCDVCDKKFESHKALKAHLRTHKGGRPFLCPECGKAFSQAGNLRQHMLRHGDAKSFECPYCPSTFSCPNDVSNHKIIHEGIKRHICDICGYSFGKSNQLAMHKRYHNNIKPYKCDCCEMRFPRMSAQRRHMRTHTGEKPYKCKYCERAFAQTNDHMKHLRIHLGDNVYRCKLCPLAFPSGKEMRLHYATHKNEDAETRERNMKALHEEETKLQLKFTVSEQQEYVGTKSAE